MAGLAPDARSRFAARLKRLRLQRGFARARFFARSLGIEENRYTRYERAEVEPSLTLLHKMCEMLAVTPNELLGAASAPAEGAAPPASAPRADGRADQASALAWRLASAAVALRQEHLKGRVGDPLETLSETGSLFNALQERPFGAVADLVRDPSLKTAAADRRSALAELIGAFTQSVTAAAAGRQS
jgi:transcriptional regulator with XRE-family HTH domain